MTAVEPLQQVTARVLALRDEILDGFESYGDPAIDDLLRDAPVLAERARDLAEALERIRDEPGVTDSIGLATAVERLDRMRKWADDALVAAGVSAEPARHGAKDA